MNGEKPRPSFMEAATKADVAFVAADTVLALRSVQLALLALRAGDQATMDEQVRTLDRNVDKIWERFQELMGSDYE